MTVILHTLKQLLNSKVELYNQKDFIEKDPISIPHKYSKKQDIEIAGLFAAILAWGNRTTIINNTNKIMQLMGDKPYEFIMNHEPEQLKPFTDFVHRTFNATDLLYFITFLQYHYRQYESLESAFVPLHDYFSPNVEAALVHFHNYFFSFEHPDRTKKHIATPVNNSACKRINMYLRWMVRKDEQGVDFGIWAKIKPSQLICPLDVHVARVAYRLQLIPDLKATWQNAVTLTAFLKKLNPNDPVIYDYALFGIGVAEKVD